MINLAGKVVLVVDDDPLARQLLCGLLRRRGYQVDSSENGLAALRKVQTSSDLPALIFLDLVMPIMDGYTFLRLAREDPRVKKVPIVVTTAELCTELPGADAILNKPLKPAILMATLQRFLAPAENPNPLGLHGNKGLGRTYRHPIGPAISITHKRPLRP